MAKSPWVTLKVLKQCKEASELAAMAVAMMLLMAFYTPTHVHVTIKPQLQPLNQLGPTHKACKQTVVLSTEYS